MFHIVFKIEIKLNFFYNAVQSIYVNLTIENILETDCTELSHSFCSKFRIFSSRNSQIIQTEAEMVAESGHQEDSQVVGLLGVQVVPAAGVGGRWSRGRQLCWARTRRAGHETALGGVGNGNGRAAALLLQHCFNWAEIYSVNTSLTAVKITKQNRKFSDCSTAE